MLIACPRCETTFSLPDDLYKPGKKARCSQCGFVFSMPGEKGSSTEAHPSALGASQVSASGAQARSGSSVLRTLLIILISVLLLLLLGYGGYLIYGAFAPSGTTSEQPPAAQGEEMDPEQKARIDSIGLDQIRQYQVENSQVGRLMVIQGAAVNNSSQDKDYVVVEARLRDGNGNVLATVQQLCGAEPTLFQLQTLNEQELKEVLNSRTTILIHNVNIPPGGRVPFVVIFPNPSETTRTFEVKVIDVRDSPK